MGKAHLLQILKNQNFPKKIIKAFSIIKREDFIPKKLKSSAYENIALPIGKNQTISQPYTIAMMLSMLDLKPNQKVLEIGSGSGYVLALISEITKSDVYGVERIKELAEKPKENLKKFSSINVYFKNGQYGLKEHAPFDRILISAAVKKVPRAILHQLIKEAGNLVAPIDEADNSQSLIKIKRDKNEFIILKKIPGFIFVRFIKD